jgi:DNA-binding NarL/FixJ family response regulator
VSDDQPTTVVVVDPSPDLRWIVRRVLQRKGGFDVVGDTDDAADGLELTRLYQPDIVLVDVDGPVAFAADLVRELRTGSPSSTVVGTVSGLGSEVREPVLTAGAAGLVRKDVTLQHTFDQLWSVLAAGPLSPRAAALDPA